MCIRDRLDRDYYPHLAPQYINVSPIGAIGQGMYGAARGMQAFADNQQPSTQPPVWDPRQDQAFYSPANMGYGGWSTPYTAGGWAPV